MSTRVVERVDDWDQEPFSGGYRELQDRADAGFSGVFRAGGAELFLTRGTVVGIRRGSIEDFEAASGTVFTAPTDALPLLAVMQDRSDEVRAKYYTEDTSVREVDGTLEDGGFTGYVELSENVLSGDYYLVYHQGHSMSVAFVGNSQRLITGDEAFEQTDGEVGIYEVRPVDIEPIEIPDPVEQEPDDTAATGGAAVDGPDDGGPADDRSATETPEADEPAGESVDALSESPTDETTPATDQPPATDDRADVDDGGESAGGGAAGAGVGKAAGPDDGADTSDEPTETPSTTGTQPASAPETDGQPSTASTDQRPSESGAPTEQTPGEAEDERTGETATEERRRASESLTDRGGTETDDEGVRDDPLGGSTNESEDRTAAGQSPETGTTAVTESETSTERSRSPEPATDDRPARGPTDGTDTAATAGQATSVTEHRGVTEDDPGTLETRSIPSLDPERSASPSQSSEQSRRDTPGRADASGGTAGREPETATQRSPNSAETGGAEAEAETSAAESQPETAHAEPQQTDTEPGEGADSASRSESEPGKPGSEVAARIEELEELLEERETELQRLESDLQTTESERDSLRRELDQVQAERDELAEEVEKLESELRRLEEELGAATDAQQRMTPQEALTGTDLFVRYASKGDATLGKARERNVGKDNVDGNLQLEKHTQFEADVAAVGGREYDQFLEDTVAYKFARWVVYDLLFEIQSTGHTDTLSDLYEALPKINRIELNGAVNATYVENGEQVQSTESFDVVFRERMGDPLLVANINESRQGATEGMMEQLITAAERVGQTSDQFAAAFLVTESFFEPEALETVEESTRGGILSRDKRKSFVNLSRKNGYHLCLVEARNENFHLEVPEL